jgi:hypothetical protein
MTLDLALQPQSQFLFNHRGEILVDHLGRFEALGSTCAYLDEHFGALAPMRRSNRSGDPVDYRTFYTPDVVDRVGQIYADDIRMLGYSFDGPAAGSKTVRTTPSAPQPAMDAEGGVSPGALPPATASHEDTFPGAGA